MNQRRLAIFGVALASVFTAPAFARTGYRIVLANGVTIVAADEPVRRGTILTFHQATSGALTGIPAEQVTSVDLDTAPVRPRPLARTTLTTTAPAAARPLEPGETLVIGATGDGALCLPRCRTAAARAMALSPTTRAFRPPMAAATRPSTAAPTFRPPAPPTRR